VTDLVSPACSLAVPVCHRPRSLNCSQRWFAASALGVVIPCSVVIGICFNTLACSRLCRGASRRPIHPPRAYRIFRAACVTFVRRVAVYPPTAHDSAQLHEKHTSCVCVACDLRRLNAVSQILPFPQAFAVLLESTSTPSSLQVYLLPPIVCNTYLINPPFSPPPPPPPPPQLPVEGDASTLVCKPYLPFISLALFPRRRCSLNLSQVYSAHVVQCARSLAEVLADTHTKVPVRFHGCRRATSLASFSSTRSPSWPTPLQS
jgi:hypothetical protein